MNFENKYISSQYIFSDWIFLWFLLYVSPINESNSLGKHYFNPLLSLYIALFFNIIMFVVLLSKAPRVNVILKFMLMVLCEKVIPILVLNGEMKSLDFQNNIPFTLGLFTIYLVYLYLENTNFYEVYKSISSSIIKDDNNTPFFALFHRLFGL
jgi:hypothetical protein